MQSSTFWGAFTVGNSQRSEWYLHESKNVPAPKYDTANPKNKWQSPTISIGNSQRSSIIDLRGHPGVGQYETKRKDVSKLTQGVTMLGKNEPQPSLAHQGSVKYNPKLNLVRPNSPSFSFTIRQGEVWSKDTPAPNQYFLSDTAALPSEHHFKRLNQSSSSNRSRIVGGQQSRPQSSDPNSASKNKGFSTAQKLKVDDKNTPGIGCYDIENSDNRVKTPAYMFDKSRRQLSQNQSITPGPGTFNLVHDNTTAKGPSMGHTDKINSAFTVRSFCPGPGAYDPKLGGDSDKRKYGYAFGSKSQSQYGNDEKSREERKKRDKFDAILRWRKQPTPGPSDYQEIYQLDRQAIELRETSRFSGFFDESVTLQPSYIPKNDNPGPGEYEQEKSMTKRHLPAYPIQDRPKKLRQESEEQPGPADYQPPEIINKNGGPMSRIGRSLRSNQVRNKFKPGPGSYFVNHGPRGRSASIGNSDRFNDPRLAPGPGYYDISGEMGKLPSYMTKRKMQQSLSNSVSVISANASQKNSLTADAAGVAMSENTSPEKLGLVNQESVVEQTNEDEMDG